MYKGRDYDASWREPMWERVYKDLGGDKRAADIGVKMRGTLTHQIGQEEGVVFLYCNIGCDAYCSSCHVCCHGEFRKSRHQLT
mgnify:CR=1 FL=1